jgi:hypothetical protein
MRLLRNSETDRGIEQLRGCLTPGASLDLVSLAFSLLALAERQDSSDREEGRNPKCSESAPHSIVRVRGNPSPSKGVMGAGSFTTQGLGLTPGGRLGLIRARSA